AVSCHLRDDCLSGQSRHTMACCFGNTEWLQPGNKVECTVVALFSRSHVPVRVNTNSSEWTTTGKDGSNLRCNHAGCEFAVDDQECDLVSQSGISIRNRRTCRIQQWTALFQ